ncbi:hypothetical protein PG996_006865 [Apiospora saccharicola]|uniref:Uncharacterized protein n=1 Tax=Apiospora saccharicola TaxID=335842 RepID=A0ABR1V974_9PEZI
MAYTLKVMRGWFTRKETASQQVVEESSAPEPRLYPDTFIYVCDHELETNYDNCYLRDLYRSLVVHDLVPPPEKQVYLNHYCPKCLGETYEKAWSPEGPQSLKNRWSWMLTHPVDQYTGDRDTNRASALFMFHDLWTALNIIDLKGLYFDPRADAALEVFFRVSRLVPEDRAPLGGRRPRTSGAAAAHGGPPRTVRLARRQ